MLPSWRSWLLRPHAFWRLNVIGWSVFAVAGFLIRAGAHQDLGRALGFTFAQEPVAILLSGLLRLAYRHPRLAGVFRVQTAACVIGLSLVATLIQTSISHLVIAFTGWHHPTWTPLEEWLLRIIFIWLVYMGWSLCYFWIKAEIATGTESEKAQLAREEAQRTELRLLRAQLDPHFLFNSLNGVAAEISPHPRAAEEMVRELSEYLRYSLDHRDQLATPLAVELDAMTAYLRIEQARFGRQLSVRVKAEGESRLRTVPSFLLQPLIENAVKYGLQTSLPPWEITIRATAAPDTLSIEVVNSGHMGERASRGGVGLETLRRRLALHYPERHEFTLTEENGLIRARLHLREAPCFV